MALYDWTVANVWASHSNPALTGLKKIRVWQPKLKLRLSLIVYWYWHNQLLNKNVTQYDLLKEVRVAYLVQAFVVYTISALIYYHYKSFDHLASQTQHQALTSSFMKLLFVQCHKIQRVCSHIIQMFECSKYMLSKRYSYQGMRH